MAIIKRLNLNNIFLFLFLVIFPFGQIIRIGILQPIDLIVAAGAIYAILKRLPRPTLFKYLENFLFLAGASWIFSISIFPQIEVLYGVLYLMRLSAYVYFFLYVWNFVRKSKQNRVLLIDSLIVVSIASAVFGWIQFSAFPIFYWFKVWGWDEHYYRLAGTFLDPSYIGLILVFGLLTTIYRYIVTRKISYLAGSAFLLISLAFTYSRGSYLAFFIGLATLAFYYRKSLFKFAAPVIILVGLILILPTRNQNVLEFTRAFSALARVGSYENAILITKTSPVFGVGYDNFCLANLKIIGIANFASHSCSGADSSLLLLFATTGVIGLISFLWAIVKSVQHTGYDVLYTSSLAALLVHSLFSNSMFYPWIMGWIVILLGTSLRGEI